MKNDFNLLSPLRQVLAGQAIFILKKFSPPFPYDAPSDKRRPVFNSSSSQMSLFEPASFLTSSQTRYVASAGITFISGRFFSIKSVAVFLFS